MKNIQFITFFFAFLAYAGFPASLCAQVNESELNRGRGQIEFQNYTGQTPPGQVNTRNQIRNIGYPLGTAIRGGAIRNGDTSRYYVIHSQTPAEGDRLDADIIGLGAGVGVDHIRNLRLIIQGYLEGAYNYSAPDAALLSEYITIYNAVFRGNRTYFSGVYKTAVLQYLDPAENIGLSTQYTEWPGRTLIVIPLGNSTPGSLSAIDTSSISGSSVIDEMKRTEEDDGSERRTAMADLKDREADEADEEARRRREAIAAEEARLAEEQARLAAEQERLSREEAQRRERELAEREAALAREREAAQRAEDLANQKRNEAEQDRQDLANSGLGNGQDGFAGGMDNTIASAGGQGGTGGQGGPGQGGTGTGNGAGAGGQGNGNGGQGGAGAGAGNAGAGGAGGQDNGAGGNAGAGAGQGGAGGQDNSESNDWSDWENTAGSGTGGAGGGGAGAGNGAGGQGGAGAGNAGGQESVAGSDNALAGGAAGAGGAGNGAGAGGGGAGAGNGAGGNAGAGAGNTGGQESGGFVVRQDGTPAGVVAMVIVGTDPSSGNLVRVDSTTGKILQQSSITVKIRTVTFVNDKTIIALSPTGGSLRMVEINADTLQITKTSKETIDNNSLIWVKGSNFYAIISGGKYSMGRFDPNMILQAQSANPIHQNAGVAFQGEMLIITQSSDGQALLLDPLTLTEKK